MNPGYAVALILTAIPASIVATMAVRRRTAAGAPGLAAALIAVVVWTITYALRWLSPDGVAAAFWLDATYLGVVTAPTAFFVVAAQVTAGQRLFTRKNLVLVSIEPLLTLLILFTDRFHGLFYAGIRTSGSILNGGPWFWFNAIYSYALLLAAAVLLVRALTRARDLYRRQLVALLVGMLLPWLGNIVSLGHLSPFADLDTTPFIFFASGIVIAFGLFRYRLFDIVPVAHDLLVESMTDGMIVVDTVYRILDLNPAARAIFGISGKVIGQPVAGIKELWTDPGRVDELMLVPKRECIVKSSADRSYEVSVSPVRERRREAKGWLIVLHDITERKKFEDELRYRSTHDILTGLYNRQYYEEAIDRLQSERRHAISVVMMDLDGLKEINDSRGHSAGDALIRETAGILAGVVEGEDILARAGGDEFLVIMPDSGIVAANAIVEKIRREIHSRNAKETGMPAIRLSMGIAVRTANEPLFATMKRADDAMYREKNMKKAQVDA